MSECTEWSQPDGDHFHGLCVNEFEPEVGSEGCPVCVSPVPAQSRVCGSFDPLACLKENPLSSSEPPVFVPANLNIEFQTGDMTFQRAYTCNRGVSPGDTGKTLIPELVGVTVPFPVISSEPFARVWQTAWIPCGSRFSSYRKTNFATGATIWYYREDWDLDVRVTMQVGNGQFDQCYFMFVTQVRRRNIVASGTPWWGLGGPQGPAYWPCSGSQIAYYLWGFADGQVQNIPFFLFDENCIYEGADPTYLVQLDNDVNRAKPVFNQRIAAVNCATAPIVGNSIDEEVVCEVFSSYDECRSYSVKTYPRFTSGVWDYDGCGVVPPSALPPWQPGIITMRIFEA